VKVSLHSSLYSKGGNFHPIIQPIPIRKKSLGIYVHIPFCRSKCEYCDFYSIPGGRNNELMDRYLEAVVAHIRESAPAAVNYTVDTVYFGGGTPSFFGAGGLKPHLRGDRPALRRQPRRGGHAGGQPRQRDALSDAQKAAPRASTAFPSACSPTPTSSSRPWAARTTTSRRSRPSSSARRAGFGNVSVDLMFGLPNQSREQWMGTLRNVLDLKADHISCYGLKVEKGTKLYDYRECANLPDDDAQADMYFYAVETLESFGYYQYEISNFAKDGFACRHNMKYWVGDEYLGFGPCGRVRLRGQALHNASRTSRATSTASSAKGVGPLRVRDRPAARAGGGVRDAPPAHRRRRRGE
jgi:coproporphyrinogen III oxidase-like Fe-S oxidoreductase